MKLTCFTRLFAVKSCFFFVIKIIIRTFANDFQHYLPIINKKDYEKVFSYFIDDACWHYHYFC